MGERTGRPRFGGRLNFTSGHYVIEQRTGFCSYFYTGTGFDPVGARAKKYKTATEARSVKIQIEHDQGRGVIPLTIKYITSGSCDF